MAPQKATGGFFRSLGAMLTLKGRATKRLSILPPEVPVEEPTKSPMPNGTLSNFASPEADDGTSIDYSLFLIALSGHVEELQDSIDYDYPVFAYNICQKIKPAIEKPEEYGLGKLRQLAEDVYEHCTRVPGAAKLAIQLKEMAVGVLLPGEWDKRGDILRALQRLVRALSDEDQAPVMIKDPSAVQFIELPVWFATCRRPTGSTTPSAYFGTQRGGDMELGMLNVSVPDVDNLLQSGVALPFGWEHDGDREVKKKKSRLLITKCLVIQKNQFGFHVKKITKGANVKEAVMYVHGYNNKFSAAAMKYALMAYKMRGDAPLFMFSWPSFQSYQLYTGDEANVMWAVSHFLRFLEITLTYFGFDKVHLISHSMGARVVLYSLARLAPELLPEGSAKLGRLVVAAPDFDAGEFRLMAPSLSKKMERITVYCSSDDAAVQLSTRVHGGHPRLGDFRQTSAKADVHEPYEAENIDTIDCTALEKGVVRHSYIFNSESVLEDATHFLKTGCRPSDRPALVARESQFGLKYYEFKEHSTEQSVIEQEMTEEGNGDDLVGSIFKKIGLEI